MNTQWKKYVITLLTVVLLTIVNVLTIASPTVHAAPAAQPTDMQLAPVAARTLQQTDPNKEKDAGNDKVVVCHATGSATNPYVRIEVSTAAVDAHMRHQNNRDIINPVGGICPGQVPSVEQVFLKICKVLATGTTAPAGTLFTFTAGGRTVSVAPGTCTVLTFDTGTQVTLTETGPTGYRVTAITITGAGTGTTNVGAGTATVTLRPQVTEVTFTNQRATGFIEICKEGSATGTFTFDIAGRTTPVTVVVTAGATQPVCSQPIELPAGQATVTERAAEGTTLAGVRTLPTNRLVSSSGRSATITVVAGGVAEQTLVIFRNEVFQNLKICKQLAAGTTAPAGTLFTFTVAGQTVSVAPGSCTAITVAAGNQTITETGPAGYRVTAIAVAPSGRQVSQDLGAGRVVVNVGTGVTEVTFTNQRATGFIEICKETEGGLTGTFTFTVEGQNYTINVTSGATQPVCTQPIRVTAGQVTVTEAAATGTTLAGVRTLPTSRLVSSSGRSATATVVASEDLSTQTLIIFRNRRS